jgi:hypothetical protein
MTDFGEIPNRKYQFLGASEAEQRRVFANNSLYDLWRSEKFPFEALAVYHKGSFVQASYIDMLRLLSKLGGVSYPKAGFASIAQRNRLNAILDPIDRASSTTNILLDKPKGDWLTKFGQSKYPDDITQRMVDNPPVQVRSRVFRIIAGYKPIEKAPWYVYNDVARTLDLGIRKTTMGSIYYVS